MKNSTLLFRSLAIILFIAGSAHLATYASQNTISTVSTKEEVTVSEEEDQLKSSSEVVSQNDNENNDYIVGKWKVVYNSKDFKGAVIYNIKKVETVFKAYTDSYEDENGDAEKAEGSMKLVIKQFDGYKGKGVYKIEYEGQEYDVKCHIDMINENTFKLSYDYYGYGDIETWKRQ